MKILCFKTPGNYFVSVNCNHSFPGQRLHQRAAKTQDKLSRNCGGVIGPYRSFIIIIIIIIIVVVSPHELLHEFLRLRMHMAFQAFAQLAWKGLGNQKPDPIYGRSEHSGHAAKTTAGLNAGEQSLDACFSEDLPTSPRSIGENIFKETAPAHRHARKTATVLHTDVESFHMHISMISILIHLRSTATRVSAMGQE